MSSSKIFSRRPSRPANGMWNDSVKKTILEWWFDAKNFVSSGQGSSSTMSSDSMHQYLLDNEGLDIPAEELTKWKGYKDTLLGPRSAESNIEVTIGSNALDFNPEEYPPYAGDNSGNALSKPKKSRSSRNKVDVKGKGKGNYHDSGSDSDGSLGKGGKETTARHIRPSTKLKTATSQSTGKPKKPNQSKTKGSDPVKSSDKKNSKDQKEDTPASEDDNESKDKSTEKTEAALRRSARKKPATMDKTTQEKAPAAVRSTRKRKSGDEQDDPPKKDKKAKKDHKADKENDGKAPRRSTRDTTGANKALVDKSKSKQRQKK